MEPPRPDWPARTDVVGPLHWDPADSDLALPPGDGPLVFVSASTAASGREGLLPTALSALDVLRRGAVPDLRLAATVLGAPGQAPPSPAPPSPPPPGPAPPWAAVGPGRQDPVLRRAAVVVSGGGHGMLSRALVAGVPMVLVPGGGDQRELARRAGRRGAAVVIERSLTVERLAKALERGLNDLARPAPASPGPYADPVRLCETVATRAG